MPPAALQMAFASVQSSVAGMLTTMAAFAADGVSSTVQRRSFPASTRRAACTVAFVASTSAMTRAGVASTGAALKTSSNATCVAPSWLAGKSGTLTVTGTASTLNCAAGGSAASSTWTASALRALAPCSSVATSVTESRL